MAVAIAAEPSEEPRVPLTGVPPANVDLDAVASGWQCALDAAERALTAGAHSLASDELERRRRVLNAERHDTADLLVQLGRAARVKPEPWLSPVPVTQRMLGLPDHVRACLFDLDGVLTDSAILHAAAWAEVFDNLLLQLSERTGRYFIPFDPVADYRAYIDGRPRLEGIHTFLESRGIHLPEGRPQDGATAATAHGLARHKGEALARAMRRRHVTALAGTRRYLEAAGHAGLLRAVVSGSSTAPSMLAQAGLATLVEARVDAETIGERGLRSRPAPDLPLAACRLLQVEPEAAVAFVHSPDGVVAGHAAGATVVGIGDEAVAELLAAYGADRLAPALSSLLDPRLRSIG